MRRIAVFLLSFALPIGSVLAQEAPLSNVTIDVLVERLKPSGVRLRGVRGLSIEQRENARIDLAIGFTYDSAELTDDARRLLDVVADSFATETLRDHRFQLAGHTDARGGEGYNLLLSERRAEAVKAYLSAVHGIEASRLETAGYGKSRLLFPEHPEDARNRRVEVMTLE
jgi:outer membrane protein OmpA-like peptidoglycan-associated protein